MSWWDRSHDAQAALMESRLSANARHVGMVLVWHANGTGDSATSFPSRETLARETGKSVGAIRLAIRELEASDCRLRVTHAQRFKSGTKNCASNSYTLILLAGSENEEEPRSTGTTGQPLTPVATEPRSTIDPGQPLTPVKDCPPPRSTIDRDPGQPLTGNGRSERMNGTDEEREGAADASPTAPVVEAFELTPEPGRARTGSAKGKRRKSVRTGILTPCPDDFAPSEGNYECGSKLGCNRERVDLFADKMRDSYRSQGRTYVDWHAAFNTFMRNQVDWDRERAASRQPVRESRRGPILQGGPVPDTSIDAMSLIGDDE